MAFRIGRSSGNKINRYESQEEKKARRADNREERGERRRENRENRGPLFEGGQFSLGQAASVAVPLYSMLDNQNARDQLLNSGVDLEAEDFVPVVPTVRSARRPNFTTKTRLPGGSSLAEREAGLRFQEAQSDLREDKFNEYNENFINDQRGRNAQIVNAAESQNTQARNRVNYINNNTKLARIGAAQDQATASAEALFQNIVGISNQKVQGNAAIDAAIVGNQIRSGNLTGQDSRDALDNVKGATYRKRSGRFNLS